MEEAFLDELILLGKRLRNLRKHRGMSLLDLQVSCGIQDSKISRIERGLENVEIQTVYKIAKGLQVELKVVFNYGGELPDNSKFRMPVSKKRGK